jgi:hypothetical protein
MNAMQRLEAAVLELITGGGDLQERLRSAFAKHLKHIRAGELPAELSSQLQSILHRYGSMDASGPANRPSLNRAQAVKLASDIFQLSCAVSQGLYH